LSVEGHSPRAVLPPRRAVWGALIALLLLVLGSGAIKGVRDLESARRHEHDLQAKVEATRESIARLKERIVRMKDDPATLERLAREELGLVRPGDVVIVLPATATPGAPPPAPR